jgi:hypothetical protein
MTNRRINIFVFIISLLIFAGCKKNTVLNDKQAVFFQVDYTNNAWGYQHNGFFIDGEGNVLSYKNPRQWNFPDKNYVISEDLLKVNLESCEKMQVKISAEDLNRYAGYIKNISLSKVTAQKNVANDAGSVEYICYMYSGNTGIYKGYLIKKEGDFTCENLNFFSKRVSLWLKNINETLNKN